MAFPYDAAPDLRKKIIDQSRSLSPRSITSSGFSPAKALLGVFSQPPRGPAWMTSDSPRKSRCNSTSRRATTSNGKAPFS